MEWLIFARCLAYIINGRKDVSGFGKYNKFCVNYYFY